MILSTPGKRYCDFVYPREEVLDTYPRPLDPLHPVVGVDEVSQVLHQEVRAPWPAQPGRPARQDYEYRRRGTANLFMITAPCTGWRHVEVTARRTKLDFAQILHDLVDVHFPQAQRITVVCDNLNPHKPGVLYARYEAATARRIARRLEWVHTPKHASWLHIAEIEINALKRQALALRVPDAETLRSQVTAWATQRNQLGVPVHWRFTTDDARVKLRSLYPLM